MARFEPAPATITTLEAEPEEDLDGVVVDDLDDDADLELSADEMDDIKDEKD